MNSGHLWCERLLAPLPDALIAAAVPADDGHWEYVESELVKLGTLAHSQVDLAAVSEAALVLLETAMSPTPTTTRWANNVPSPAAERVGDAMEGKYAVGRPRARVPLSTIGLCGVDRLPLFG